MRPVGSLSPRRKNLEPAEIRRLRTRYADGMPITELVKLHRIQPRQVLEHCADILRPDRDPRKRQAPSGLSWSLE